jgi:hypothetical protein
MSPGDIFAPLWSTPDIEPGTAKLIVMGTAEMSAQFPIIYRQRRPVGRLDPNEDQTRSRSLEVRPCGQSLAPPREDRSPGRAVLH